MAEVVWKLTKMLLTNPIIISVIILGLIAMLFWKKIVGRAGEYWTKKALSKLPSEKYKVLNDVLISVNGKTHQIDHIVVSNYGIFVIETKQYNGFFTGNKYDKDWVMHAGKNKYYYTNPIRQNYGHVKAVTELLNIDESKVFNIVCIPSVATLKIEHDGELTRYDTIVNKILSYKNETINNKEEIINKIINNNIIDRNIQKEHIKNIKNDIPHKDLSKCPKCGGNLIERTGKYGKFIGCSNYPKCTYTRKIN